MFRLVWIYFCIFVFEKYGVYDGADGRKARNIL